MSSLLSISVQRVRDKGVWKFNSFNCELLKYLSVSRFIGNEWITSLIRKRWWRQEIQQMTIYLWNCSVSVSRRTHSVWMFDNVHENDIVFRVWKNYLHRPFLWHFQRWSLFCSKARMPDRTRICHDWTKYSTIEGYQVLCSNCMLNLCWFVHMRWISLIYWKNDAFKFKRLPRKLQKS